MSERDISNWASVKSDVLLLTSVRKVERLMLECNQKRVPERHIQ